MFKRLLTPNSKQAGDTGLAFLLICLLIIHFTGNSQLLPVAIIILLITMVWPDFFRPLAFFWFGLSRFLSTIGSNVILTLLFVFLVTPIGLIRRLCGADSLNLKDWKKNDKSVFKIRDYKMRGMDLEKPF